MRAPESERVVSGNVLDEHALETALAAQRAWIAQRRFLPTYLVPVPAEGGSSPLPLLAPYSSVDLGSGASLAFAVKARPRAQRADAPAARAKRLRITARRPADAGLAGLVGAQREIIQGTIDLDEDERRIDVCSLRRGHVERVIRSSEPFPGGVLTGDVGSPVVRGGGGRQRWAESDVPRIDVTPTEHVYRAVAMDKVGPWTPVQHELVGPELIERAGDMIGERAETRLRELLAAELGVDVVDIVYVRVRTGDAPTATHRHVPVVVGRMQHFERTFVHAVNAETGKVAGDRPYSAIKIGLFAHLVFGVIGAAGVFARRRYMAKRPAAARAASQPAGSYAQSSRQWTQAEREASRRAWQQARRRQHEQARVQRDFDHDREAAARTAAAAAAAKALVPAPFYRRLGVPPSASTEEITSAFRGLAVSLHPDKVGVTGDAHESATRRFQDVSEAYETLRDPSRRRTYDHAWACR